VHDTVDVAGGVGDSNWVEEVELLVRRHYKLVAGSLGLGPECTAEHAGSTRDQQSHIDTPAQILPLCRPRAKAKR
jgi:hypothetical protein